MFKNCKYLIAILPFALTSAVISQPLNIEKLQEVLNIADAAIEFYNAGKTVKGDREVTRARTILNTEIKKNKLYSTPDGCLIHYDQYVPALKCTLGEKPVEFRLYWKTKNEKILEDFQECSEGCQGTFTFVPWTVQELYDLQVGMHLSASLSLAIEIQSVAKKKLNKE